MDQPEFLSLRNIDGTCAPCATNKPHSQATELKLNELETMGFNKNVLKLIFYI